MRLTLFFSLSIGLSRYPFPTQNDSLLKAKIYILTASIGNFNTQTPKCTYLSFCPILPNTESVNILHDDQTRSISAANGQKTVSKRANYFSSADAPFFSTMQSTYSSLKSNFTRQGASQPCTRNQRTLTLQSMCSTETNCFKS